MPALHAYVGSRTTRQRHARGEGLSVYRVDPASGALARVQLLQGLVNPAYLCWSPDRRTLYAVHGDQSQVSSFRVDAASGCLSPLNRQDTGGLNPVHLAVAPDGAHLLVSNHLGGSLAVLPLAPDGALLPLRQRVALEGPAGPHRLEQQQAKPHFNAVDPSGRLVLVPDKGLDRIFSFHFTPGGLQPAPVPFVATREGAGPRHLAFHPALARVYAVNELDATVTTYQLDPASGALTPLQRVSSLPSDFAGDSRAAAILVDAPGRRLYASNRGHDSLAVWDIAPGTGLLGGMDTWPSGGRTPRFFTLSPCGQRLYLLNEDSDSIVLFPLDARGRPRPGGLSMPCGSPVCMVFSEPSP